MHVQTFGAVLDARLDLIKAAVGQWYAETFGVPMPASHLQAVYDTAVASHMTTCFWASGPERSICIRLQSQPDDKDDKIICVYRGAAVKENLDDGMTTAANQRLLSHIGGIEGWHNRMQLAA